MFFKGKFEVFLRKKSHYSMKMNSTFDLLIRFVFVCIGKNEKNTEIKDYAFEIKKNQKVKKYKITKR